MCTFNSIPVAGLCRYLVPEAPLPADCLTRIFTNQNQKRESKQNNAVLEKKKLQDMNNMKNSVTRKAGFVVTLTWLCFQ
jgi:hypothetical protein